MIASREEEVLIMKGSKMVMGTINILLTFLVGLLFYLL